MRIKHGFTMTELLIAMMLGIFSLAMVLTAFSSLSRSAKQTQQIAELQQNAQFMLSFMQNELHNMGFWGGKADLLSAASHSSLDAPDPDCFNVAIDSGSFPRVDQVFVTLYAQLVSSGRQLNCIPSALANSELLQIKRLIGQNQPIHGLKNNRFYLETDWLQSRFVSVASANLDVAKDYYPYQHLIFYLQKQYRAGEALPVLMRKRLIRNASGYASIATDSIIDGVERLHFEFGIDADLDGSLDYQQSTTEMTEQQWQQQNSRIVSIKFYVLLRALTEDRQYRNNEVYIMGKHRFSPDGDNYRRLLISSTVFFHNSQL